MESDETLPKNEDSTNKILEAINGLRQEMKQQIGDSRREMNERFAKVETEIEAIKQSQFTFDVRLERVQVMAHDALNIGHDLKADVKILTAEVCS